MYLGKYSKYRKALFRNLAVSIIQHEMIKTTLPKSKTLRKIIEPLITLAKNDSVHNRRLVKARLNGNAFAINKLFKVIAPKFRERPGGYTKILKCGYRKGDCAPMGIIKFV
jgi:large subunit ribosomal protein L17